MKKSRLLPGIPTVAGAADANPFGPTGVECSTFEFVNERSREPPWELVRAFLEREFGEACPVEVAVFRYSRWRKRWSIRLHERVHSGEMARTVMRELYAEVLAVMRVRLTSPNLADLLAAYELTETGRLRSPWDPTYSKVPFPWLPAMGLSGDGDGFLLVQHDAQVMLLLTK